MLKKPQKLNLDKIGVCTSSLCIVHCVMHPLILVMFPLTGLALFPWEGFELGILALSSLIALFSLGLSYRRNHNNTRPILLASVGFTFFIVGRLWEAYDLVEVMFSIAGGAVLIIAHLVNLQISKRTEFNSSTHSA